MAEQGSRRRPEGLVLLRRILGLWWAYITGQMLMALIIGALTWLVGEAIGLPGAFWLGLLAGILETVPGIGPLIALIPAVLVAVFSGSSVIPVENWVFALIVAGAYFLVQQVGALFIHPRLVGQRLDLPPLLVLAAVIVGGLLLNVVGAYLAVPVIVTVREIARYIRRKRQGLDPFAEEHRPLDAAESEPEDTPSPSA